MDKKEYRQYLNSIQKKELAFYAQLDRRAIIKTVKKRHKKNGVISPFYYISHQILLNWDYFTILGDIDATEDDLEEWRNLIEENLTPWFEGSLSKKDKDAMIEHLGYKIWTFETEEDLLEHHQNTIRALREEHGPKRTLTVRTAAYRLAKTSGTITADDLTELTLPEEKKRI